MDAEGLKLKIDSKEAQADLQRLELSLDKASGAAGRMEKAFKVSAASTSQSLGQASRSMEKYAQVAALLSKIKIGGTSAAQIRELGAALDSIGRAQGLTANKVKSIHDLGNALSGMKTPSNVIQISTFLNSLGKVRMPSAAQVRNLQAFGSAMSGLKPSANASAIVLQLNQITHAATNASAALRGQGARGFLTPGRNPPPPPPPRIRAPGSNVPSPRRVNALSGAIGGLTGRFNLAYQAGSLLTTMFASFTLGTFIRGVYEANIQILKLQKGLLFSVNSFEGASQATDKYIGISQELGLSIKDNIETYSRFVIASKAANMSLDETNKVYHAVGQAMTVIGSSAAQQQLAFYGLTEMLQKGVVYSKEFNRQIGAQLPGNAILGARALSKLEGHVVSVTEFFRRMHTGTLLSPEFVPQWAEEVEKMYHPLLALAQARPDVAITRLANSFFVFARSIGSGSFMTTIGREINNLTAKFVTMDKDGIAHLTPGAQKLSDTLGNNLASAIGKVGTVMGVLVDNFDKVIMALKGLLAYKVADFFLGMGKSALTAASRVLTFSGAVSAVGSVGAPGAVRRSMLASAAQPSLMSRIGTRSATAAVTTGRGAMVGLGAIMGKIGVAGLALSVVLAMVSDKFTGLTSAAGNAITFGDIVSGAFDDITNLAGKFAKRILSPFMDMSNSTALESLGRLLALTFGFIKMITVGFTTAFWLVGDAIGALVVYLKNLVGPLFTAMGQAGHLHFKDAYKTLTTKDPLAEKQNKTARDLFKSDLANAATELNPFKTADDIMKRAGESADQKGQKTQEDQTQNRAIEAATRQQSAAAIIEEAAQKFEDASDAMVGLDKGLDPAKVLASLKAFAEGDRTSGMSESEKKAYGPVGDKNFKDIIASAADNAGITPQRLYALGAVESGFNPKKYKNDTSSAVGPYQITDPTYKDMVKANGGKEFDRNDLAESSNQAAKYLKSADTQAESILGRKLSTSEGYVPYVLGAAGGARLLHQADIDPTGLAVNSASAEAVKANHNLFYTPGTKKKDGGYTQGDALTNLSTVGLLVKRFADFGGAIPDPADESIPSGEGSNDASGLSKTQQKNTIMRKRAMAILAIANPAAGASSQLQDQLIAITKLQDDIEQQAKTQPWAKTLLDNAEVQKGFADTITTLGKKVAQANDPLANQNRLTEQSNAVMALRAQGLTDEADAQEKLNALLEQNYKIEDLNAEANAARAKQLAQDNRTMQSRIDLQKEMNDLATSAESRTSNNPLEAEFNRRVAATAAPGQSIQQALAQMSPEQRANLSKGAAASLAERGNAARGSMNEFVGVDKENEGLNKSQLAFRNDFKKAMQEQRGMTTDSYTRLMDGASDAQKQFAANFAKSKQEIENPPGFQRWVDALEPFAKRMEDIKANFVENLSSSMTDSMMGDKVDWAGMVKNMRRQLVKAQVDEGMKGVLGALGLANVVTQSPEEKMASAGDTFMSATDKFGAFVDQLSSSGIGGGGAANDNGVGSLLSGNGQSASLGADGNWNPGSQGFPDTSAAGGGYGFPDSVNVTPGSFGSGGLISSGAATPNQAGGGGLGGFLSGLNPFGGGKSTAGSFLGALGTGFLGNMIGHLFKPNSPSPTLPMPGGIIGTMSNNTLNGTQVAGHANLLGSILSMGASMAMGSPGSGGGWDKMGLFLEGGLSSSPVAFGNVPHYSEGTANTSGFPAILHPNEAVIPLSRGRKIPIENSNDNRAISVSSHITVVTPDADSFRKSRGSISRDQNKTLRRAALRNLT